MYTPLGRHNWKKEIYKWAGSSRSSLSRNTHISTVPSTDFVCRWSWTEKTVDDNYCYCSGKEMKKLYNDGRDTLRSCGINYKNDTDIMLNSSRWVALYHLYHFSLNYLIQLTIRKTGFLRMFINNQFTWRSHRIQVEEQQY